MGDTTQKPNGQAFFNFEYRHGKNNVSIIIRNDNEERENQKRFSIHLPDEHRLTPKQIHKQLTQIIQKHKNTLFPTIISKQNQSGRKNHHIGIQNKETNKQTWKSIELRSVSSNELLKTTQQIIKGDLTKNDI